MMRKTISSGRQPCSADFFLLLCRWRHLPHRPRRPAPGSPALVMMHIRVAARRRASPSSARFSKTAVAGEIDCLDPGGFGAVTITKVDYARL